MFDGMFSILSTAVRLLILKAVGSDMPYQFEGPEVLLESYDFVVVGAGTGGCAVAARLSELPNVRVLVLEAGGPAPIETAIPGLGGPVLEEQPTAFDFMTTPVPGTQYGYINSSYTFRQGRLMGGSTVINAMIYARGNYRDYDNWAKLGNLGWDYASVLPYFKKLENFTGYETHYANKYRGRGGPVTVEKKRYNSAVSRRFYEAAQELGYEIIDDTQPRQIGLAPHHVTTHDGIRTTASESYLKPNVARKNLHIQPLATVTKIIFDKKKRAAAVEFQLAGQVRRVLVSKEVVVSAGVINTPKLLMLSGIGPKRHLQKLRIPVVAAVEGVGRNLQDHPGLNEIPFASGPGQGLTIKDFINKDTLRHFMANRTGFLAAPGATECNGYFSVKSEDPYWPDVYMSFGSISPAADHGLMTRQMLSMKNEFYDHLYLPLAKEASHFTVSVAIARPKSRGWVQLKSSDPGADPLIYFNYLDDPSDVRVIVKGIRLLFDLMETRAMKERARAEYKSLPVPACSRWPHLSDGYWECLVKALVSPNRHACGTCKMAPDSDPMGVVSNRLKLRGVTGVRVVDAAIMPAIITANTQAACYMIGEKGADLIKQDWGYPTFTPDLGMN